MLTTISSGRSEEVRDEGALGLHVAAADVVNLAFPDHRHGLIASQCSSCRC